MNLYPYQIDNSQEIIKSWESFNSVLYQLPTGGGKTVVINDIIEKILDKKILILVHRQEIIFQIRDRLLQKGIKAGVLIGGFEENIGCDILIGSILTVARDSRLQTILDRNFDYMIIDEAHHACSDSYIKVITEFKLHNPEYKLLGVTATPYRKDKKKLNKIFDMMIKGPTYSKLREDGFLADYTCYAAKLEGLSEVDLSGGDFKLSELSKYMRADWLIEKAIKMYKDKGEGKQMLVFCVDKKHSIQVKESYIKAGYTKIAHVDSDTPDEERRQINQDYRDGKLDIIVSIQTFTEGVDLPNTGVIQLLRPTLSVVLYLQILGRGTRLKDNGSKLIILDLSNNSYEHGLLDSDFTWNLNNDEPNPNKKINKIGARKKGKFTINADEIDEEYLEVEEISHDEFLLENQDGIQIAENENKVKDDECLRILKELVNSLNTKHKLEGVLFKLDFTEITNYGSWETIKINDKYSINYDKGKNFKFNIGWTSNWKDSELNNPIIIGKIASFLQQEKIQNQIISTYINVKNIINSKTNINDLKQKIKDINIEKCLFKINELLSNNIFQIKLDDSVHSSYISPRYYGRFDTIMFRNKPNKLKSIDAYDFYLGDKHKERHKSVKKEVILDLLYDNWYKSNK